MIVRTVKLRLTRKQEKLIESWMYHLTSVWNWAIKKIEHDAKDGIYYSEKDFQNLLAGHSQTMEIPSHTMQGILCQAYDAWSRCFKKISGKPHLKGRRNKLGSVPFPDALQLPKDGKFKIPGMGKVRFIKQELPVAAIKCGRIKKKASGWYLCLWLDTDHKFPVKDTDATVGIDPGFHTLLTLSDGVEFENPRELRRGAKRLAQAQRGGRKKLAACLLEKQANRRNDRNHKISRRLVEDYKIICWSDDNFKAMAHLLGKSVTEAGLGDLAGKMAYKSSTCGRQLINVNSKKTTMTCSECWNLTGPTGLDGLKVRQWVCSVCGAVHGRDSNSSKVVRIVGLGISHKSPAMEKLTGIPRL